MLKKERERDKRKAGVVGESWGELDHPWMTATLYLQPHEVQVALIRDLGS